MLRAVRPQDVADTIEWACRLDVQAAKPGNVSFASPGHGMRAEDFLVSARAIAGPLSAPGRKIGERIAEAVDATWSEIGLNTNLGIVLLAAPLAHATLSIAPGESLPSATMRVLSALDADDAARAFSAIVRANPAGLGTVERLDVRGPVQASLLEAMRAAAHRDSIARQYAIGYRDVFEFGVPHFRTARALLGSDERAVVACYLGWLGRCPDTHIARKHGLEVASQVREEALQVEAQWREARDIAAADALLQAWDAALKSRGVNPGTSADLTVASVLAAGLERLIEEQVSEPDASRARFRKGTWMSLAGLH